MRDFPLHRREGSYRVYVYPRFSADGQCNHAMYEVLIVRQTIRNSFSKR
jgi:hypothetical protein